MSDPVHLADLLYSFRSISFQHAWPDAGLVFNVLITVRSVQHLIFQYIGILILLIRQVPTIVPSSTEAGAETCELDNYFHIGVEGKGLGYCKVQIGQSVHASYLHEKFKSDEFDYKDNEELSRIISEISREYAIIKNTPQIIMIE
jgi:hypothetical protein